MKNGQKSLSVRPVLRLFCLSCFEGLGGDCTKLAETKGKARPLADILIDSLTNKEEYGGLSSYKIQEKWCMMRFQNLIGRQSIGKVQDIEELRKTATR